MFLKLFQLGDLIRQRIHIEFDPEITAALIKFRVTWDGEQPPEPPPKRTSKATIFKQARIKTMQLDLQFKGSASIQHLNIRKEGADKDVLAIDIKMKGEAPSDVLYHLLGCAKAKAKAFWDEKTDEQRGSFGGIKIIKCWTVFENCTVTIDGKEFRAVKVHGFDVYPANYLTLKVACKLTVSDIHDADVGFICERQGENVQVHILGEPGLFDDNE